MISQQQFEPSQGQYIDFKDKDTNQWQVGLVLSKTKNTVRVRAEGWSSKFDELITINSNRIKPFRSIVRGYTGQQKNSAIRDHWKFSIESHKQRLEHLRLFVQQQEIQKHLWTQFVRGQHYFYLDFLLGQTFTSKEQLELAYQYLRQHIMFANMYLKRAKNQQKEELSEDVLDKKHQNGFYQILDGVYILTGLNIRHITFQKNNAKFINEITPEMTHQKYIGKIIREVGLDLTYIETLQHLLSEKAAIYSIPFVYCFFRLFLPIQKGLLQRTEGVFETVQSGKAQRKNLVLRLFELIQIRLDGLKSLELKSHQNQKQIDSILNESMAIFFKYGLDKLTFEWIARSKVRNGILLVETDSLQRKIKGINKLKELFQASITNNQYFFFKLSLQRYMNLIKDGNTMQTIFIQNQHPQILKKGAQLWLYFYKEGGVLLEDLLLIWSRCIVKHEAIRKIIFQFLIDIIPILKEPLSMLVEFVLTKSESEGNLFRQQWEIQYFLAFIGKITESYSNERNTDLEASTVSCKLIEAGYKKLLLLQFSQGLSSKITDYAKLINKCQFFNTLIKECYVQIGRGINLKFHLELLTSFYLQANNKDIFLAGNAISIIVSQLQGNPQLSLQIFKLITEVCNFAHNLKDIQILNVEQFDKLWKISYGNGSIKYNFYQWLLKKSNEGSQNVLYQINGIISNELREKIFKDFLCNFSKLDYINLSIDQFNIFKQFLFDVNQQDNRIQILRIASIIKIIRVKQSDIIGTKFIWDIFINCKNDDVLNAVNKLLITLYLHIHPSSSKQDRKSKVLVLLGRIQKHLKDGNRKKNQRVMRSALALLKSFIDIVKQKCPQEQQRYGKYYYKYTHKIRFEGNIIDIQTSLSSTYYAIKKKISQKLKLPITDFQLFNNKNEQIGYELTNIPFCFYQEKQLQIIHYQSGQSNIVKSVNQFLRTKLELLLIEIIEDQLMSQHVYNVLEQLQVQSDCSDMFQKLRKTLKKQKQMKSTSQISTCEFYLYHLLLKIVRTQIERQQLSKVQMTKDILLENIHLLGSQIYTPLMISFLSGFTDVLYRYWKIISVKQQMLPVYNDFKEVADSVCERCLTQIQLLCKNINQDKRIGDEGTIKKVKIFFNCLSLIQNIKEYKVMQYLISSSSFYQIINRTYLNFSLPQIRLIFTEKIKKIVNNLIKQRHENINQILQSLLKLFIENIYAKARVNDGFQNYQKSVTYFYTLIAFLIQKASIDQFKEYIVTSKFFENLIQTLKNMKQDKKKISPNYIIKGHLDILHNIYERQPSLLTFTQMNFLLQDCLLLVKGQDSEKQAKYHNSLTIGSCLQSLIAGTKDDVKKILKLSIHLNEYHLLDYWRNENSWQILIQDEKKEQYRGLENPGCICYLNSFIQQLYMNSQFKNNIKKLYINNEQGEDLQVIRKLKQLFLQLEFSQQQALDSVPFSKTIKGFDKKPMLRIFNQMDIDEFSNILFDRIQDQITRLGEQNFVKGMFGGVYAHQIISDECPHSSERQELFLSIGLEVKKNINQGFECLIREQILDGENKYFCERCDKKVRAQKMLTIKNFPNHLIIALKRFQYNYQIDAKIKLNDYCQFPHQLNLIKYSQQYIMKDKSKGDNIGSGNQPQQLVNKNYQYQLKGVVIHSGSADSGHYYSIIKDQAGLWYQFNDSTVQIFDIKNLPDQAFGSVDSTDQKCKNAYLLIYKKVHFDKTLNEVAQGLKINVEQQNNKIIRSIKTNNKVIQKYNLFFSKQYQIFIDSLWIKFDSLPKEKVQSQQFYSYLITFFLTIKIRESNFERIVIFSKKIKQLIQQNEFSRKMFLQIMKSVTLLQQIFVYCFNRNKCLILSSLLATALTSQLLSEKSNQQDNNYQVQQILKSINSITTIHGNINQINALIKQILMIADDKARQQVLMALIDSDYHITVLLYLLGNSLPKQYKQNAIKRRDETKNNPFNIQGSTSNEGRKSITAETQQSWRVLTEIFTYLGKKEEFLAKKTQVKTIFQKQLKSGNFKKSIHEAGNIKPVYYLWKCIQSIELLQQLCVSIQKGLKDYQSTKFRPFLLLILFIVGQVQNEKIIQLIINSLEKILQVNEKYFLQVNLIHQWIEKMITFSSIFQDKLLGHSDLIKRMILWTEKNPKPALDLVKKHKNPQNDRLLNRLNGIIVATDPKKYQQNADLRKKKFNLLLRNRKLIKRSPIWKQQFDFSIKSALKQNILISQQRNGTMVQLFRRILNFQSQNLLIRMIPFKYLKVMSDQDLNGLLKMIKYLIRLCNVKTLTTRTNRMKTKSLNKMDFPNKIFIIEIFVFQLFNDKGQKIIQYF